MAEFAGIGGLGGPEPPYRLPEPAVCYNETSRPNLAFIKVAKNHMKNKSKIWQLLAICIASIATPLLVHAQQPPKTIAPPPPELQKLDEGEAPAVTVRKPGEAPAEITEKRDQGRVTEVKVNSAGSTYYVKPQSQAGTLGPNDGPVRGAQWQIKEFDLGQKPRKEGEAAQTNGDPGLPPPTISKPGN